jgi:hypothetical protein
MALVAAGLLTAIVAGYVGGALMPPHGHNQPHAHPADPHEHAVVGSIRTASAPLLKLQTAYRVKLSSTAGSSGL